MFYRDGVLHTSLPATVSAFDLGVMQGAAAFEMTRSFGHVHFKLQEHLDRLKDSCALLGIPLPDDFSELPAMADALCEAAAFPTEEEHRLLIVVSPGCAPMYKELPGVIPHSYSMLTTFPLRYTVAGMGKAYTEGIRLVLSNIRQVPSMCVPSRAKHRSRLHFHLAQQEAAKHGPGTWALMRTIDDYIAECPGANVVAFFGDHAICITHEALPGISQRYVADILRETFDLDVGWASLTIADLYNATEIWITGTPFCILPAVSLEGRPVGTGKPGEMYQRVLCDWSMRVGVEIDAQVKAWDAAVANAS